MPKRTTKESESIMSKNTKATKGANKEVISSAAALEMVSKQKPQETKHIEKTAPEVIATTGTETIQATAAPATATAGAAVIQSAPSKASKANQIFAEMFGREVVPARKEMIAAVVQHAGLTPAGAATYLQNYKSKHGLVHKAAPTA